MGPILLHKPDALRAPFQKYATDGDVAVDVARWAFEQGAERSMRIALCGHEGDYDLPRGWTTRNWVARKGYQVTDANGGHSGHLERVHFSPHCLAVSKALKAAA